VTLGNLLQEVHAQDTSSTNPAKGAGLVLQPATGVTPSVPTGDSTSSTCTATSSSAPNKDNELVYQDDLITDPGKGDIDAWPPRRGQSVATGTPPPSLSLRPVDESGRHEPSNCAMCNVRHSPS
jgi:hypothetical protein